jgi:hypothetical protein
MAAATLTSPDDSWKKRLLYDVPTTRIKGLRRVRFVRRWLPENNPAFCLWLVEVSESLTWEEHKAIELTLALFKNNMTENLSRFLRAAEKARAAYYDSRGELYS